LALSPEQQRTIGLLNSAAWLRVSTAEDDPVAAAKRLLSGPRSMRDLGLVISQPGLVLAALKARLRDGASAVHKTERIGLCATCEQFPDPSSRLRLSDRCDGLGLPISRIDWHISEHEKASMTALAEIIADEFRRLNLPTVRLADWLRDGRHEDPVLGDSCHPAGTTRISTDPRHGVVDPDCKVHGVENLYVAGSSVFPTNGHANPTLMIVALAIRLADHLKHRLSRPATARPAATPGQVLPV
jgi:choline dehydrogenase-like flavoprotein